MTGDQRAARERRFWDRYTNILINQGINPSFVRWHVLRAKSFIKAFPGRRLADLGPDDIAAYLTRVGRQEALKPRQFRQLSEAIQILYRIIRTE